MEGQSTGLLLHRNKPWAPQGHQGLVTAATSTALHPPFPSHILKAAGPGVNPGEGELRASFARVLLCKTFCKRK